MTALSAQTVEDSTTPNFRVRILQEWEGDPFQTDHSLAVAWLPSPALRAPWKSCLLAALSFSGCNLGPGEQGAGGHSCLAR